MKRIKVLIIDDSALARDILSKGLSSYNDIEVIGTAADVFEGRDKIVYLKPQVITLDIEMPKMDGLEFLKRLIPQYPIAVVVVSAMTKANGQITLEALENGALDFIQKPSSSFGNDLLTMMEDLHEKIVNAAKVDISRIKSKYNYKVKKNKTVLPGTTDKVILMGASTGGTVALRQIIEEFPPHMPGSVIVQHMPPGFTTLFAEKLNKSCMVEVKEAEDGDRVRIGRVLIAPGSKQTYLERSGAHYIVKCREGLRVNGHCPSVEVLFDSAALCSGVNTIAVMLTGMGSDGADAMVRLRETGARTMAQDEESSVVYGMPKESFIRGGAEKLIPLSKITDQIIHCIGEMT